jgi:hypothetical protein
MAARQGQRVAASTSNDAASEQRKTVLDTSILQYLDTNTVCLGHPFKLLMFLPILSHHHCHCRFAWYGHVMDVNVIGHT